MNVQLFDHIIVLGFFGLFPIHAAWQYRKLIKRIESGAPGARAEEYRWTMALEWGAAIAVLGWWLFKGRSLDALGFGGSTGTGLWIGIAVALGVVGGLLLQRRAVDRHPEAREKLSAALGNVEQLLPHTKRERVLFDRLSITAGICEELIYRGFLIWYLAQFLPLWGALVASSVLFGYAHIYQGTVGAVRIVFIGLFLAGLFWLTSSLWIPMFVHAAADLLQGRTIFSVLSDDGEQATETTSTGISGGQAVSDR